MRYYGLSRLTRLTFMPPLHNVDPWLQTFLRTSIGTPNSLQVITLRLPTSFPKAEWNALDVILSNAMCISHAHLYLVAPHSSSTCGGRAWAGFMAPALAKELVPNLIERGGFSLHVESFVRGVYEQTVLSLPHR